LNLVDNDDSAPDAPVPAEVGMTVEQREQFDRDGYLILRGALSAAEVDRYSAALDEVYDAREAAGALAADRSMHQLSAVDSCPDVVDLIDHPKTFPLVWSILGWNVHIYHSHLDIHPPLREPKPFRFEWHQDGGRQNRELEVSPRPRMSVKLAYWLSDVSETGRGNLKIVPGSHLTDWIQGPPRRDVEWPDPEGAIEVQVAPGDVVFFDRRIWHCRSNNYSEITRKAIFLGYTFRWIAIRDELARLRSEGWYDKFTPVQRQLLGGVGDGDGDHAWGHYPATTPLYDHIKSLCGLDPAHPPLRP
jgi:ectoine hydroxylase-related dioxygenase (phytanoyl-CoA dioxygenase family)